MVRICAKALVKRAVCVFSPAQLTAVIAQCACCFAFFVRECSGACGLTLVSAFSPWHGGSPFSRSLRVPLLLRWHPLLPQVKINLDLSFELSHHDRSFNGRVFFAATMSAPLSGSVMSVATPPVAAAYRDSPSPTPPLN